MVTKSFQVVSTLFINGKASPINSVRKSKNPLSWLELFVVVSFNKISLFSKDLITFTISFISLFVQVIPAPNAFLETYKTFLAKLKFFNTSLKDTFLNNSSALLIIFLFVLSGSKMHQEY